MAEHNSVLEMLKDEKLSEKPYADGRRHSQDFV